MDAQTQEILALAIVALAGTCVFYQVFRSVIPLKRKSEHCGGGCSACPKD